MIPEPPRQQIDSWQAAEANAAAWMRHWGFTDAHVTPPGPDGGVDVRSARAIAQVKYEAVQVGAPTVQRLVGARGLAHHLSLLFFSGAGYARPAVDYADMMGIALFKYGLDGAMTPMNTAAGAVIEGAQALAAQDLPLEDVRRWADASAARQDALSAAGASWWRRNGWLAWSVFSFIGIFVMASEVVSPSEPSPGDAPPWAGVLFYLGSCIGSYYLWRWQTKRRAARTEPLRTIPDPGPVPAAARMLGGRMPGTAAGATAEETAAAVQEFSRMVPGLNVRQCRAIVVALQRESDRAAR